MKIHACALILTSELRKKKNFDHSIFFHENSCNCIESHISTKKKKRTLTVQYFFMKIHASALNLTSELRKKKNFDISIFSHKNSCKCIKSHISTKKKVKFESSVFFMKNHASALNLTSELKKS